MKKLFLPVLFILLLSCGQKKSGQQATATSRAHPEWAYNAVIYEVNIRQYTPEGTFSAFSQHLSRLQELGVDILWLMPVQPIGEEGRKGTLGSYYSIRDYMAVNPEFGTMEDLKRMVRTAHEKGMKVILDWVANHTSRDAIWTENHSDWYRKDSVGNLLVMYDWTDIAPLDYQQPAMRHAMTDAMKFWIREADIDGFRCDVAYEVPTDFWEAVKDSLTALKSDIFLLAEAEKPELNESVFDAFYAWDFHHTMNRVAQGKANVDSLRTSWQKMKERFPAYAIPMLFTSNHDENSWNGTEFERMGEAAATFAVLTYMLPGMPLIYSGQEAGFNRRLRFFDKDTIAWDTTTDLSPLYRSLAALKRETTALQAPGRSEEMSEIATDEPRSVWAFRRAKGDREVVSLFNLSAETLRVTFVNPFPGEGYRSFPDNKSEESRDRVELKPWEYRIFYKEE